MASGFKLRRINGETVSGEQMQADLRRLVKSGGFPRTEALLLQQATVKKVTPRSGKAVALVEEQNEVLWTDRGGELGPKNAEHHVRLEKLSEEVWVRSGGAWKLGQSTELRERVLIDGKLWKREARAGAR